MKTIQGTIVGGAGYTGGELLRWSLIHPHLNIQEVISRSQAGLPIEQIHTNLVGQLSLDFSATLQKDSDVYFLCMGHGQSTAFVENHAELKGKIIDLSHDFRLQGSHHFQYGLPEAFYEQISKASQIANPGCFATAIQMGLLPMAKSGQLPDTIHIQAITGSTGAGQKLSPTSHFSWRNNNLSVYKAFNHQHLGEIKQTLEIISQAKSPEILFVPIRGDFTRGIFASIYFSTALSEAEAEVLYRDYYQSFPQVIVTDRNPDLKQVVGTNNTILYLKKYGNQLHVISIIDNLIKGAVGQAIQNMNLLFGLDLSSGLRAPGIVY